MIIYYKCKCVKERERELYRRKEVPALPLEALDGKRKL